MKKIILKIYYWYLLFEHRKHDEDVCCCGGNISEAKFYDSICAHGGCRSMKWYAIENSMEKFEKWLRT